MNCLQPSKQVLAMK